MEVIDKTGGNSMATNFILVAYVRKLPLEALNLQSLSNQIGELRVEVANIRPIPPGTDPAGRAKAPSNPPPITVKLAIAKKPSALKPAETVQFKVNGNPAPKVAWSLEGPGSIDSNYGFYRAPDQFTREATVKVTANSRTESQSVTFTLKGTPPLKAASK